MKFVMAIFANFLVASPSIAGILSSSVFPWTVAHNASYDFSLKLYDQASTIVGELDQLGMQYATPYTFGAVEPLSDHFTNGISEQFEIDFAGQQISQNEFWLVNHFPLSSADFHGYQISGYQLEIVTLVPGPTTDIVNTSFIVFGDVPEPSLGIMTGSVLISGLLFGRTTRS